MSVLGPKERSPKQLNVCVFDEFSNENCKFSYSHVLGPVVGPNHSTSHKMNIEK